MQGDKKLDKAKSIAAYKQAMAQDSYFEKRHYHKVDVAYQHFQQRLNEAGITLPASVEDVP